ncbi:centrosomal protein of 112 kDa isoform X1 [Cynoglossus semilaevis]|uniref:centrosomal protein of 112 kDa isoform X1 n=1 Tax=Cynoglossus semilaevis TaxID=244447 RepID=UPI000D62FD4F|nr:centrosomal protein of 112 kDa isoform X1 [Cynoglossus semilaevis]
MSTQEESWERLDTDFEHFLLDIKPYVLKHPNKTERQQCAIWIKKLCDPATCPSGLTGRKNRNIYARLLLHMLRKGVLETPFTNRPEPGSLKILPTYISIYFEEPPSRRPVDQGAARLPEWVTGELGGFTDEALSLSLLKDRVSSTPVTAHHSRRRYGEKSPSLPTSSSPIKQSSRHEDRRVEGELKADLSHDDTDLEARLNSWNLGIENPRYLREKPIPLSPIFKSSRGRNSTFDEDHGLQLVELQSKEIEMKVRVLESKHQEEKLKMQQRHDADVEKILERKNGEIEELKNSYRAKLKDSEEMIRKLERKVQGVLRESQVICESKDKQIAELKNMVDHNTDSLQNEWEKKLHAAVTEMEQEKFELQKKHTSNIQELLDDTNHRLAKMEAEYNHRSQAAEQTVRELELRVKHQSVEVEKGSALRQKVSQEKAQLELQIASLSAELQEAKRRVTMLQKEKEQQKEQHEEAVQQLQAKHETDMSHLYHEHALSAAKASEVLGDFEKTVSLLKQQLLDSEHRRHQLVRDHEIKFQQQKDEMQISCEKKVFTIHSEAEKEISEAKKKTEKLEEALREMESQLDRARESHGLQIQQADMALEQFKNQMEKVEKDVICSRSLRENQAKEFSEQLDALRHKYEQQMAEQSAQNEQERTRLQQQHSMEKDRLVQDQQREVSSLQREARAALQQHQQHTQEWKKRDAQTISALEAQLSNLRDELQAAHTQHRQHLAELAAIGDKEKQRAFLDKEAALNRLRSDMERIRSDLERSHRQERDATEEKTNSRLKQMEKECSVKLSKSAQLIAELQTSVCDSKMEAVRLQQAMDRQLAEANARWDEERKTMTHHADQTTKALQKKVETLQRQLHSSEKKLLSKELETEEKVTSVRQEYQEKIKGLMPAELRQELEDTITSLKAQVRSAGIGVSKTVRGEVSALVVI